MGKKIIIILALFVFFSIFCVNVNALECDYGSFKIDVSETTGQATISKDTKNASYYVIMESLKEKFRNAKSCVQLTACTSKPTSIGAMSSSSFTLYSDRAAATENNADLDLCSIIEVGGKKVDKKDGDCDYYDNYYNSISQLISDYNNCNDNTA